MKAFTDIEQSKKLAEILPLESSDMEYLRPKETNIIIGSVPFVKDDSEVENSAYDAVYERIPCWSLTALLNVLPFPQLSKDKLGSGKVGWMVSIYADNCRYDSCWHDNSIDACYEIIIKLHERKML
jgi:hypothetical protein